MKNMFLNGKNNNKTKMVKMQKIENDNDKNKI